MRKLILILLIPGLLLAQTEKRVGSLLTIKQAETVKQPARTIERVSKRTLNSLTFEKDSVGSGAFNTIVSPSAPLCWDSAGKMMKIDLSERVAKTKGFQKAVKIASSFIEYDSLGNMRYEKGGLSFEVSPLFRGVKMVFEPQPSRMKATYFMEEKGPDSLAWTLKDPYGIAGRKIERFTARDAAGELVDLIETRTATSLSVRIKSTKGVTWPVAIDPTIQDTVITAGAYVSINATYTTARNATSADFYAGEKAGAELYGGNYRIFREPLKFSLSHLPEGARFDSAKVNFVRSSTADPKADTVTVILAAGTFYGVQADGWFNDVSGWTETGAYSLREYYDAPYIRFWNGLAKGTYTATLNDTALVDLALAANSGDSVRVMIMDKRDRDNVAPPSGQVRGGWSNIYLTIFYNTGTVPFMSTLADSARASAILVGAIDSTGGLNCTARGFQWWIDADTTTISKSGTFGAGTYRDTIKVLPVGVTVSFRSFATNANGTSYGSVQTFTTGAGGTSLIVDGRKVNRRW